MTFETARGKSKAGAETCLAPCSCNFWTLAPGNLFLPNCLASCERKTKRHHDLASLSGLLKTCTNCLELTMSPIHSRPCYLNTTCNFLVGTNFVSEERNFELWSCLKLLRGVLCRQCDVTYCSVTQVSLQKFSKARPVPVAGPFPGQTFFALRC